MSDITTMPIANINPGIVSGHLALVNWRED
jgi:hypothetical protein